MNIQDWFALGWTGWISLQSKGLSGIFVLDHSSKPSILWHSAFFMIQLSHPYMTTGKTIALTRRTFVGKVTSLLFNMLSRLLITFLPGSKSTVSKSNYLYFLRLFLFIFYPIFGFFSSVFIFYSFLSISLKVENTCEFWYHLRRNWSWFLGGLWLFVSIERVTWFKELYSLLFWIWSIGKRRLFTLKTYIGC